MENLRGCDIGRGAAQSPHEPQARVFCI